MMDSKKMQSILQCLYTDKCDIYEYKQVRDSVTFATTVQLELKEKAVPCRISFKSISSATYTETFSSVAQTIKVFLPPSAIVKEGSVLDITRSGHTKRYIASGTPAIYPTHTEYLLEEEKERA